MPTITLYHFKTSAPAAAAAAAAVVFPDPWQAGICSLLGLVFRIYTGNKGNPTVLSTAAATIRQARPLGRGWVGVAAWVGVACENGLLLRCSRNAQ